MARRVRTAAQRDAAAARRDAQIEGARTAIAAGIHALADGEGWQRWLATAANLHRYSLGNQLLIAGQTDGTARQVNGYRAWQALGRQVRKGERGIVILAPVLRRADADEADEVDLRDPDPPQAAGGEPSKRHLVWVKPTHVFDVTQTDGDPIPEPPRPQLLTGDAPPGLWDALAAQVTAAGFTLHRDGDLHGANGVTDFRTRTVTVRGDVSEAQAVKTLAHEIAHLHLHDPGGAGRIDCRGIAEVEAESVAFTIAAAHGLPTDDYSFAYIAGWASATANPAAALETAARRVHDTADRILTDLDDHREPTAPEQLHDVAERALDDLTDLREHAEATAEAAAHFTPAPTEPEPTESVSDRQLAALADAQTWFTGQAEASPQWHTAVAERGLLPEQAHALGIGWAPDSWRDLCDAMNRAGHHDDVLCQVGLARPGRGGQALDVLRGRVTFPYRDDHGHVIAFTGRIAIPHTPATPKYLNTANWDGFTKGEHVLGLDQLTPNTVGLVLVEGPWDAAAVTAATDHHHIGMATNGTAFTRVQAARLAGVGLPITMWTDPDTPGITAARNAYATLTSLTDPIPNPRLVTTIGHDPSAYATAFGATAVRDALADTRPLLAAVVDHTITSCRGQSLHGQLDTIRRSAHLIAAAPPDQQAAAIGRLADDTDLSPSTLTTVVADAIHTRPTAASNAGTGPAGAVPRPPWQPRKASSVS